MYRYYNLLKYNKTENICRIFLNDKATVIEGDCKISLQSLSQSPPKMYQM